MYKINLKNLLPSFVLFISLITIGIGQKEVTFKIKNAGLTVNGSFSDVKIDINYNSSSLSESTFKGTIQVKSVDTGISSRDKHLLKEEYFDTAKYPTMVFQSTSVKSNSDGNLSVSGNLTIKGKTQKVAIPVKVEKTGTKNRFTGNLKINRLTYGVGGSSWVMADDLIINIDVTQ